ncbi:BlaI/MecI/CopY family transcriptional regulator [Blastopirellula marina]|uniref:Transcriptional regulator n=1 Tax=Blastopirellula marina TaxID=124 RepID=A0A2S8FSJ5_9BACT|nr:BlaI/MecI/CopY family transcriptional regulator [Blastopirellula marina]PQO35143.1 transcriptional regulator [Blastopirellula marina]PQO47933.1 transcriptional regulator [Blastopirellula marina]PTL43892.1 BlaI/MecI/CopY family transcriptional regulator [Blastopirellula marina]
MSPKNASQPTESELEILQVLWTDGPATVRQVHERLQRPVGYTTVLKLLQIMAEKGLVTRDESERSHVYAAKHKREATQKKMVQDLLDRCFSGAADQLILQALSAKKLSAAELAEIRTMIDEFERKRTE